MTRRHYISLFSGAMGLDLGLEQAGFTPVACVEKDEACAETIRSNKPDLPVLDVDIALVSGKMLLGAAKMKKGEVPLVVGGPPCQAFSVYGKRLGLGDRNGQLIHEYFRLVSEIKPHVFLMENVRGLHSMPLVPMSLAKEPGVDPWMTEKGSLLKDLVTKFNSIGYRVDLFVVNAVNYGAPQLRERLMLVGNRHGLDAEFPQPQYSNRPQDGLPPYRTLRDAIGNGFVDPCPEVLNFSPRKLKYLAMVPPGGNWRSLPVEVQKESMGKAWYLKGGRSAYWRKLSLDFPCPTVVTLPNHAGTSMCHPRKLRAISVGEAAAIQEFPKGWKFQGTTSEKFRQVGNAVPVRLGMVAGGVVRSLLDRVDKGERGKGEPYREIHLRPHVRTRTYWKDSKAYVGNTSYYQADGAQKTISQFAAGV